MTVRTVGILSPGDFGSAIGRVARASGFDLIGCLAGRSELTRQRAAEAGFRDVPSFDDLVRQSDLILSVLVPSEAMAAAERVADALRRTGATTVYADMNAFAPATVQQIDRIISEAGSLFVDGGITGGPEQVTSGARFYVSGPDTSAVEALGVTGMDVRVVGQEVGQASGLKMIYAASTKGTWAIWIGLLTAARALGLQEAALEALGDSQAEPLRRVQRMLPTVPQRSRRWVGEMEEIAATFAAVGLTPDLFTGAADIYRQMAATPLGDLTSHDPNPSFEDIIAILAEHLPGQAVRA